MDIPPGLPAADADRARAVSALSSAQETGADGSTSTDHPISPATSPVGYELLKTVGGGGMGIVYRAQDTALDREVAIKVLRERFPIDGPAARRFMDEARITGQLQHPGIPPVHQVGTTPDGRPFLAMKLIRGSTLEELLQQRADAAADRGRFVAAFDQVCQAVAFAHANHVIHRDLKPANIMVGAFGEVQVMDWGLAKVLVPDDLPGPRLPVDGPAREMVDADSERTTDWDAGAESATREGSVLGTPAFMAPEQARGEIERLDERTDVFGLGAILCVILTGKPPFVARDSRGILMLAATGDVRDPESRLEACGAEPELVALCKHCLCPDKAGRPADAGEVAKAVAGLRAEAESRARRAELDRVRADAESRAQRLRRRARLAVAGTAIALIVSAGVAAWWWDRQVSAQRATRQRNGEAVSSLLDRSEDGLRTGDASAVGVPLEQAQTRAAEGGAESLSDRLARCREDWNVLRELDRIDELKSTIIAGEFQGWERATQEWPGAFAQYGIVPGNMAVEDAAARVNQSLVRDRLLTALDMWLFESRSADVARVLVSADPDPFRQALRNAVVADDKAGIKALADQPAALDQPPRFAVALGELEAVPLKRALQILLSALARRPGNFELLMSLGLLYPLNQADKAATGVEREKWFRAALAVRPKNVSAHNHLGNALADQGNTDGALAEFREAIRLDPEYFAGHGNLGLVLRARKDVEGSIRACREAVRLAPLNAGLHSNLGATLLDNGDLDGAMLEYQEAIRLNPKLSPAHYNIGFVQARKGNNDAAMASFLEALRLDPNNWDSLVGLGDAFKSKGNADQAIANYKEALRVNPKSVPALNNLALMQCDSGDLVGALALFNEAHRIDPQHEVVIRNLRDTERWQDLRMRLPVVAAGRADPSSPAEAIEFAHLCRRPFLKRYAVAARMLGLAMAMDAKIAGDWKTGHRYDAACYAVLAAAGQDAQLTAFGVDEWGHLIDLAYGWLRADLTAYDSLARDPKLWPAVKAKVAHWKRDSDLVAVRDPAWLAEMPEVDRKRWQAFWSDVDALLKRVSAPPSRFVAE